jgi:hypothetical protein
MKRRTVMSTFKGKVRHIKLSNKGGFVARMQIIWSYDNGADNKDRGVYEPSGYHDVCAGAEREIDLKDTGIPNGSTVQLKVDVVAGKDKTADELFEYNESCGEIAEYKISGTTLIDKLTLTDYH